MVPFEVDPSECPVTYTCALESGQADICTGVEATFDSQIGDYQFQTTDMVEYPPGTYSLLITGTVGSRSDSFIMTVKFVDPCPSTLLTLITSPIIDDYTYTLRDLDYAQTW